MATIAPAIATAQVRIELSEGDRASIRVLGIEAATLAELAAVVRSEEQWRQILSVHVGDSSQPPLLGSWRVAGTALAFEPTFRLDPTVRYQVVYRHGDEVLRREVRSARRDPGAAPAVTAVYPSAPELPENLLRFYLHFATPMSQGNVYSHIRLEDAAGRPVELAFLELPQELWDGAGRRLTLLFDPGRVKRELRPNEEEGPPLLAGRSYELVVSPDWRDGGGRPLAAELRHAFAVGPADRSSPDPGAWQLETPAAGTLEPLRVDFGEPLDRPQSLRWIWVEDGAGRRVAGEVETGPAERSWRLRPNTPWGEAAYRLRVDTRLEDVAGNRVAEPFEVEDRRTAGGGPAILDLPFTATQTP